MTTTPSRRGFLIGAAAASSVLVLGINSSGLLAATDTTETQDLTPFVKISTDGQITAILKHFEMGQGTTTGLTSLIAEEMHADLADVETEFAPSNTAVYKNLFFGMQGTGGSTAMANSFMQYRTAGAAAREMLLTAAANAWGTTPNKLTLERGIVQGAGKSASIGQFVAAAAALPVPEAPKLTDPSGFRIIGKTKIQRRDNSGKIDGTAPFSIDVQLPNQMVVIPVHPPRSGATVISFDTREAKTVSGFHNAKVRPNKNGLFVYASNTWAAFKAREAIEIQWDFSNAEGRSTEDMRTEMFAKVNAKPEFQIRADTSLDTVEATMNAAAHIVEGEFWFPNLAHAPMETLGCTIEPTKNGGVIVHDGCQMPTFTHPTVARTLGLDVSQVEIKTLYAGGSFGRRANAEADYNLMAAEAFALTDRTKPVKLVWSREDDIRGGYYRPAFAHKVRIGLDDKGNITAWDHRVAGESIAKGTAFESMMVHDGVDHTSVEGISDTPYAIPLMYAGLSDAKPAAKVLWWRSVGHTHTAYVMESMMDMAAKAVGEDPVSFRLKYLDKGTADHQRLAGVLRKAVKEAGWDTPLPKGHSRGVAVHKSFNSYVAQVAEVSGSPEDGVHIEKFTCAVDCGIAVNPDIIEAQMQGGIGFGLGAVMRNAITFDGGEVMQSNFHDYEPLRLPDIGAIHVHIIPSAEAPTGVGEPGVPPSGPALANAIAGLGLRVTNLPMTENGVSFI